RAAIASQVHLHALLEADSLQDQPPPSLRGRILQGLATVPAGTPAPRRPPRWLAGPYVLAAALLAAGLLAAPRGRRFPHPPAPPPPGPPPLTVGRPPQPPPPPPRGAPPRPGAPPPMWDG